MKFLVLTQYFPPEIGATQVRLAAFCSELTHAGHDVEVVTAMPHHPKGRIFPGYRGKFQFHERQNGLEVHRTWVYAGNEFALSRILSYLSFALTCLYGLFRAKRPDYIFVDSPPLLLAVPGWIAAKWHRASLIFNVADLWPDSARDLGLMSDGILMRAAYRLERWIYRRADHVTAVTEGIRQTLLLSKQVPAEKVLFLPNGVDVSLFRPRQPDEGLKHGLGLAGKRVILYAGNHGYAGGVDQILFAADRLRDDPSIHFLFVGDGPEKQKLKRSAASLDLQNVSFHDSVPIEQLPRYISISDLALVTLRRAEVTKGARPAKAFVMMAAGKPIVLAAEGEAEKLIREAGAGVVVPPEDSGALADAIRSLLRDRTRLRTMGMEGRTFVTAHFAWRALVRNWLTQLAKPASSDLRKRAFRLEQDDLHASP
jgi:glycosyltransferase involved in cell wall biosynthesis